MTNSSQLPPFVAHNSTVKAWCVTRLLHNNTEDSMTQTEFDALNFMDGYNLRLNVRTKNSFLTPNSPQVFDTAVYFSFINPMPNKKYKVFVHAATGWRQNPESTGGPVLAPWQNSNLIWLCHSLDGSLFPKTKDGFWVRLCAVLTGQQTMGSQFWAVLGTRFLNGNTMIKTVVL